MTTKLHRHLDALVEGSSPDAWEQLEARAREAERRAERAESRLADSQRECWRATEEERRWKAAALGSYEREEALRLELDRLRRPWWRRLFGRRQ